MEEQLESTEQLREAVQFFHYILTFNVSLALKDNSRLSIGIIAPFGSIWIADNVNRFYQLLPVLLG